MARAIPMKCRPDSADAISTHAASDIRIAGGGAVATLFLGILVNQLITTTQPLGSDASTYTPIVARTPIAIRPGTVADLPFIDALQKRHSRELGFLPTLALQGKIALGQVLIAEAHAPHPSAIGDASAPLASGTRVDPHPTPAPVGYLIAADRYFKRDEIGYVTQINVLPEYRRSLVAAELLQAQFDRSAYGCRLYCCWCAQDLKANAFWEAMGFTAIAFRTGSLTKGKSDNAARAKNDPAGRARVHIFWQKRIRAGDTTTPWWYPAQTGGGVLRADRLVFPILPGVHWRDVGPILIDAPGATAPADPIAALPANAEAEALPSIDASPAPAKPAARSRKSPAKPAAVAVVNSLQSPTMKGGFWFRKDGVPQPAEPAEVIEAPAPRAAKPPKPRPAPAKLNPQLSAMARELRDQWAERADQVVASPASKHDVKRIARGTAMPALLADAA